MGMANGFPSSSGVGLMGLTVCLLVGGVDGSGFLDAGSLVVLAAMIDGG